jgi:hypothetical protein
MKLISREYYPLGYNAVLSIDFIDVSERDTASIFRVEK